MSESLAGQTIEAARRALAARLAAAGIEDGEPDARILVGAALGLDLTGLIVAATRRLTAAEAGAIEALAGRRLAREPVARILGSKEFWGLRLELSADTLVPRPDTETVVELALEALGAVAPGRPLRIADLGTGSGAILLALLRERADAFGVGTDISLGALRTARANARLLGVSDRAAFVTCDYAAALASGFDLMVSNPPYIRSSDIAGLPPEVRDHDPRRALDGGADGFAAYRMLVAQAALLLKPGGALIVEAGQGQSAEIEALMTKSGLIPMAPARADLAGIPRAVAGRKMAP